MHTAQSISVSSEHTHDMYVHAYASVCACVDVDGCETVCTCVHVHELMCESMCVGTPWGSAWVCRNQAQLTLFSMTGSLTWIQGSPIRLGWLASDPQITLSPSSFALIISIHHKSCFCLFNVGGIFGTLVHTSVNNCKRRCGNLFLTVEGSIDADQASVVVFALLTGVPDRNRAREARFLLAQGFRSISSDCGE